MLVKHLCQSFFNNAVWRDNWNGWLHIYPDITSMSWSLSGSLSWTMGSLRFVWLMLLFQFTQFRIPAHCPRSSLWIQFCVVWAGIDPQTCPRGAWWFTIVENPNLEVFLFVSGQHSYTYYQSLSTGRIVWGEGFKFLFSPSPTQFMQLNTICGTIHIFLKVQVFYPSLLSVRII